MTGVYDFRCIPLGRGLFGKISTQIQKACDFLDQERDLLSTGFTLVGFSLGSIIGRGVLERCSIGKYIKRFISIGGVHNGIAFIPKVPNWNFF